MTEWIKDPQQLGLYKRVRATKEVWAVKARLKGAKSPVTVTIGDTSIFTPKEARIRARKILAQLADEINPNKEQQKRAAAQAARSITLGDAIKHYCDSADWKNKTREDATSTFKRWFKSWDSSLLSEITKEQVQKKFLQIKTDVLKTKNKRDAERVKKGLPIKTYQNEIGTGEAQRAFRYLSAVFNSYLQDDAGEEKLLPKGNPCNILKSKRLRKTLKPRERYLDLMQRGALYSIFAYANEEGSQSKITTDDCDLIWLLIHTGLRLDEARTMEWSAVDFTRERFTAYNTKNHTNHTLPMTEVTKNMFETRYQRRDSQKYVFPSPIEAERELKAMSASRTFQRVSAEVGFDFSAHDLRRTVATVAGENGYDIDAIGQMLNHSRHGVTAGYIQRTENKMKEMLETIQTAIFPMHYEN